MKRLIIGIDIDGVIVDFGSAILPLLSEVCARPVSYTDLCSWDLAKVLKLDEKTMADIWKQVQIGDLLKHAVPVKGAIEGLSALSKHEIWLVTSRPISARPLTLYWLHKHGVRYDHIVFDRHGDKSSVGPKFDVFVEDFAEEACTIAEAGVFTLLFDQPWNNTLPLPRNCKRVYDWNGILQLVKDLEGRE